MRTRDIASEGLQGGQIVPMPNQRPRPLTRKIQPAAPYPLEALGDDLFPMAKRLHEVVQAPPAICAQSVLAAATLAVQPFADINIDGRRFPVSEFFLSVAISGERKSSIDRLATHPHRQRERENYDKYQNLSAKYEIDLAAYEAAKREALKRAKGREAKRQAVEEIGPVPVVPLHPMFLIEEPSYEGLIKLLICGQPSVGLFSDEGGKLIGGFAMNDDNRLKTAAGLSNLWDGRPTTRVRAGDGTAVLYNRRVAMHIMAQPKAAHALFGDETLKDQGLLSRCLIAFPDSTMGTRIYRSSDLMTDSVFIEYQNRMLTILRKPPPLRQGTQNELEPRTLPLSSEAYRTWIDFHNHIEKQLDDSGALANIRGFASKAPEHAVRLAGVLTLVKDLESPCISEEHIANGIVLAQYYLTEALRLTDVASVDSDLILAEKLYGWAKEQHTVPLVDIYQRRPRPIRDKATALRIAEILTDHGWFVPIEDNYRTRGKPNAQSWRVIK